MRTLFSWIAFTLAAAVLDAQPAEVEIPTEPAEPPYVVGDLLDEVGYTIQRKDRPDLNFRIVDNRIRLYWLDENRLIVEPEVQEATVRFRGSVKGRSYHRLERMGEDTGLGAYGILPPPHIFNVILLVGLNEEGEPESYAFRYTAAMDPPNNSSDSESTDAGNAASY